MPPEGHHHIRGTLKWLREECLRTLDEAQAIEILTRSITPEREWNYFGVKREEVRLCVSQKHLREWLIEWKQGVKRMRTRVLIHATQQELVEFFHFCANLPPGKIVYIRKSLLTKLLPLYANTCFPYHTQIGFNPHVPRYLPDVVARTLEATLFEDMCALFNLARVYHDERVKIQSLAKKQLKTSLALYRATISSAFFFVESYINGVAFHFLAAAGSTVDQKTKDYLSEWDSARKRPKFVKTRDKLVHYPRIVLGASHPPLQENNCPELAFIVTKAKQLRDSIVHASPIEDPVSLVPEKEAALYTLEFIDVEKTVDSAIDLVSKIETLLRGNLEYIGWLTKRGPDGLFAEQVFD
jgi:hypothetical protein